MDSQKKSKLRRRKIPINELNLNSKYYAPKKTNQDLQQAILYRHKDVLKNVDPIQV